MLLFLGVNAQYNKGFKKYKGEPLKRYKVGLGWGFTETDQKPFYMLDGFGGWAGPGPLAIIPKTLHIERRFDPHFRLNLGITYTRYITRSVTKTIYQVPVEKVETNTIETDSGTFVQETTTVTYKEKKERSVSTFGKAPYIGVDLNILYNFRAFKHWYKLRDTWTLRNLHKEKYYFDGYFLGGLGVYNSAQLPTLNTGVGGDFWITYQWGINFQTLAKWSLNADYRFHMNHSIGVVFHLDQGNDAGALDALRRRQKRKKKVKKVVIHEKKEISSDEGGSSGEDEFDEF